jgi:hypothetical protein
VVVLTALCVIAGTGLAALCAFPWFTLALLGLHVVDGHGGAVPDWPVVAGIFWEAFGPSIVLATLGAFVFQVLQRGKTFWSVPFRSPFVHRTLTPPTLQGALLELGYTFIVIRAGLVWALVLGFIWLVHQVRTRLS